MKRWTDRSILTGLGTAGLLFSLGIFGCKPSSPTKATPSTTPRPTQRLAKKSKESTSPAPEVAKAPASRSVSTRRLPPPKARKKIDMRQYLRPAPKGFVELKTAIPSIRLSIRYHTANNFTEAPLPGYGAPGAWLDKRVAKALARVQADARKLGYGLIVYDAYRPSRASLGMVAWAKRTNKLHLFKQGYIARYSGHNKGHTIDLSLVYYKTGKLVDMGSPWDTLSTVSHTRNAKGKALKNRLLLRRLMHKHNFRNYWKEWWHFSYRGLRLRRRDVPYGCYEAPVGKFRPAKGWMKPGFKMPLTWTPKPCR